MTSLQRMTQIANAISFDMKPMRDQPTLTFFCFEALNYFE